MTNSNFSQTNGKSKKNSRTFIAPKSNDTIPRGANNIMPVRMPRNIPNARMMPGEISPDAPRQRIINNNPADPASRINIPLSRSGRRREPAPNQRLQHRMPPISHHRSVPVQLLLGVVQPPRHRLPPVVPRLVVHRLQRVCLSVRLREPADVPQLDALVLAIRDEVSGVAPAVDVRDAVHVAGEEAHGLGVGLAEGAPVPHLGEPVVATAVQDLGGGVGEGDCVDVVVVRVDAEGSTAAFAVVHVQVAVVGSAEDVATVR